MNPLNEWFEEYSCGCASPTVDRKVDLPGYCPKHGNERRNLYKNGVLVKRTVEQASKPEAPRG